MNIAQKGCLALAVIALTIIFAAFYMINEIGEDKKTYVILQYLEQKNRNNAIILPFLIDKSYGRTSLAVRSGDRDFPYSWISLDRDHSEENTGIFMVSSYHRSIDLSCSDIPVIEARVEMMQSVKEFLLKNCKH